MDLILLDIKMPEVDGPALFEVIQLFHKKAKVIVTSVYPLDEQKRIIAEATDYYDKSQGLDKLIEKVKKTLTVESRLKEILIVDDEPKIRSLFTRQLEEEGFRVIKVENGEKALNLIRENKNISLVILDILLPKTSGLDIFDIIKKENPQIKIIISSVYPKEDQEFLIFDADDYYYKYDETSILMDKINNLLK